MRVWTLKAALSVEVRIRERPLLATIEQVSSESDSKGGDNTGFALRLVRRRFRESDSTIHFNAAVSNDFLGRLSVGYSFSKTWRQLLAASIAIDTSISSEFVIPAAPPKR